MKAGVSWLFNKTANFIVNLMDWKMRVWFRMGWSRPLNITAEKERRV
jgi:hypothetical protein